ncbi:hypothetical protein ACJIZ3_007704 [Penstemon smallii]|uniref:Uncharacterized protein n=1 Tax=Penstemon smallii TaxID=265156 RepID=A0ABD3T9M4_9LAMI
MTQKGSLFKGQKKKKSIPLNRHGKTSVTRKGKRAVKPSKDLTKFINYCNEVKAATGANKDGGHLSIVKTKQESTSGDKK